MNKFPRNLISQWRRSGLPVAGAIAVVAVSGGADSAALLAGLTELKRRAKLDLRFIAAHFNHGLRETESDADEAFAAELANGLGVEFAVGRGRVRKRGNLEQNARTARYEFLDRIALESGAAMIITGHTMNDQAETFLINLMRGSGCDGLAAMREIRPLGNHDLRIEASSRTSLLLVRPLLRWAKREDTESYCRENSIDFKQDSMNYDTAFTRVRVRTLLLPMLEQFNPRIIETLAATAHLMQQDDVGEPPNSFESQETLSIASLKELAKPDLYRVLRAWLKVKRGDLRGLTLKHIEAVERLVYSRKSGKTVELPRLQTISRHDGRLVFEQLSVEK